MRRPHRRTITSARGRRSVRTTLAAGVAVALALVTTGCSGDSDAPATVVASAIPASTTAVLSSTTAAATPAAPTTSVAGVVTTIPDSFYVPPSPLPPGEPGDVMRSLEIGAPEGTRGFAILYRSTAVDGTPTVVSGVVYVPLAPPAGPRAVLAWAHGTTGLGDSCATSKTFAEQSAVELPLVTFVAQQGLVFVATDYEGLGTPGPHPYLVNQAEGRNVLDSIRAAQRLDGTGATPASDAVVWGHSQGGGAAAFAAELKPTYAPELRVVGSVVGAPAADFSGFAPAATSTTLQFGFVLMALHGFAAAYDDVSLDRLLTERGRQVAAAIADKCSDTILPELQATPASDLLTPALATDAALAARLKENSAGYMTTDVPIFLYHGATDLLVPPAVSQTVLDRYCALGVNASRTVYPDADHISVVLAAAGDIAAWVQARLAGAPATPTCP